MSTWKEGGNRIQGDQAQETLLGISLTQSDDFHITCLLILKLGVISYPFLSLSILFDLSISDVGACCLPGKCGIETTS